LLNIGALENAGTYCLALKVYRHAIYIIFSHNLSTRI
jgi:hypothetical protein